MLLCSLCHAQSYTISSESFLEGSASLGQKKIWKKKQWLQTWLLLSVSFLVKIFLFRFSLISWRQRKKQNMEHLAVTWESGCLSREISFPKPERSWRRHVLVVWSFSWEKHQFHQMVSTLLFVHMQKWMCQAEMLGNQSGAWLIYCCVNRDQVHSISESSLGL